MTNTISRKEVAQLLHCSTGTVRRLEKRGKLQPIKISSHLIRFEVADIEKLLAGGKQ